MKKILLAPLDPVHDNAVKLIRRKLEDCGYQAESMRPGTKEEEVIEKALQEHPDALLTATEATASHPISEHPEWDLGI